MRLLNSDGTSTRVERLLAERFPWVCAWCRRPMDADAKPHGDPFSDEDYNMIKDHGCCKECGQKEMERFFKQLNGGDAA